MIMKLSINSKAFYPHKYHADLGVIRFRARTDMAGFHHIKTLLNQEVQVQAEDESKQLRIGEFFWSVSGDDYIRFIPTHVGNTFYKKDSGV